MKRAILDQLLQARAEKRPIALITNLMTYDQVLLDPQKIDNPIPISEALYRVTLNSLETDRSGIVTLDNTQKWFVLVFNSPLRLMIIGAVHIAQALAPLALHIGYDVTVIDPRHAFATKARFPNVTLCTDWPDEALKMRILDHRTAVVTLTHDPKIDDPALIMALSSTVFYIGALGSQRTHAKRLQRLKDNGIDHKILTRIHGPVGLAINAVTPAEIAVSILAQMTSVLRKHDKDTKQVKNEQAVSDITKDPDRLE